MKKKARNLNKIIWNCMKAIKKLVNKKLANKEKGKGRDMLENEWIRVEETK